MSNIMKSYPGHTIDNFFGDKPMTAAQFFVLHAQLVHENNEMKWQQDKAMKESQNKKGRK